MESRLSKQHNFAPISIYIFYLDSHPSWTSFLRHGLPRLKSKVRKRKLHAEISVREQSPVRYINESLHYFNVGPFHCCNMQIHYIKLLYFDDEIENT